MDFQWEQNTWTAPDGKVVPYKTTDITHLFPQIDDADWEWDGMGNVWIEAAQWPRNTKVVLCRVTTLGGGDFDGIDEFTQRTQLAQYSNTTFWADVMRDKADIQQRALKILA